MHQNQSFYNNSVYTCPNIFKKLKEIAVRVADPPAQGHQASRVQRFPMVALVNNCAKGGRGTRPAQGHQASRPQHFPTVALVNNCAKGHRGTRPGSGLLANISHQCVQMGALFLHCAKGSRTRPAQGHQGGGTRPA